MRTQIGTSDGFIFQLPPIELIMIWLDQTTGIPFPEIFTILMGIGYVWFWGFWKLSIK